MINSFDIRLKYISLLKAILTLFLWQEHGNKSSVGCSTRSMPWRTWGSEICSLAYCYKTLERLLWVKCDITWRQHRTHFKSKSWWILLPLLFLQLWKRYLEKFVVVTQYFVSRKMISSKLLPCQCNFLHLKWGKIKSSIFSTANMTVTKI